MYPSLVSVLSLGLESKSVFLAGKWKLAPWLTATAGLSLAHLSQIPRCLSVCTLEVPRRTLKV